MKPTTYYVDGDLIQQLCAKFGDNFNWIGWDDKMLMIACIALRLASNIEFPEILELLAGIERRDPSIDAAIERMEALHTRQLTSLLVALANQVDNPTDGPGKSFASIRRQSTQDAIEQGIARELAPFVGDADAYHSLLQTPPNRYQQQVLNELGLELE